MRSHQSILIPLTLLSGLLVEHTQGIDLSTSPLDRSQQSYLLAYAAWRDRNHHAAHPERPPRPSSPMTQVELHLHLQHLLRHGNYGLPMKDRRALYASLVYMLDLDENVARDSIDALNYWRHSEHFLEYHPSLFLDVLVELRWPVRVDRLRHAITKLESLLPTDKRDMIDCAAGKPIGKLLQLLAYQDRAGASSDIEKYRRSPDPYLSYAAQLAALELRHRPKPTLKELVEDLWGIHTREQLLQLRPAQRLIAECIAAHEGAMSGRFVPWFDAVSLVYTAKLWRQKGFPEHADALLLYLTPERDAIISEHAEIYSARDAYRFLEKRGPLYLVAEDLINNEQLLRRL